MPECRLAPLAGTRIAHCITGTASHGNLKDRHPIYQSRSYGPLRKWLDALTDYGIVNDVFMSLDLRIWPSRRSNTDAGQQLRFAAQQHSEGVASVPRVNASRLDAMLRVLSPVSWQPYEALPLCGGGPSACLCTGTGINPGWWEQNAKSGACMELVRAHEARRGVKYDWVFKLRSDLSPVADDLFPELVLSALAMSAAGGEHAHHQHSVWSKGWQEGTCYGQADFFAAVPRKLVRGYFSVANASCAWARSTRERVVAEDAHVRSMCPTLNERLLVEHVESYRAHFKSIHEEVNHRDACNLVAACRPAAERPASCKSDAREDLSEKLKRIKRLNAGIF